MTNDLFGNFGGLMRGLSGLMPQDDPNVKQMNLQSQLGDLQAEETGLYVSIGKQALAEAPDRFPEQTRELTLVKSRITSVQAELAATQQEQEKSEREQRQAEALHTCPRCGTRNPDGVKFCQECGTKLGPVICTSCGAPLSPGSRFCGKCGAMQEG